MSILEGPYVAQVIVVRSIYDGGEVIFVRIRPPLSLIAGELTGTGSKPTLRLRSVRAPELGGSLRDAFAGSRAEPRRKGSGSVHLIRAPAS